MALNPNIILQGQKPRRDNLMGEYANALQLKTMQRDIQKQDALTAAMQDAVGPDGAPDYSKVEGAFLRAGDPKSAYAFAGMQRKRKKTELDIESARITQAIDKAKLVGRLAGSARDQNEWDKAASTLAELGIEVPQVFDPEGAQHLSRQALSAAEQAEHEHKNRTHKLGEDRHTETVRHNMISEGAASRTADAAMIAAGAARTQSTFDNEQKMRKELDGLSKDFYDVESAYTRIASTLKASTKSAGATLAAATSIMKLLDPGSVVRESELIMALDTQGVLDKWMNIGNTLANGKVLTADQVDKFKQLARTVYTAAQQIHNNRVTRFRDTAQQYNLDPDKVGVLSEPLPESKPEPPKIVKEIILNGQRYGKKEDGSWIMLSPETQ